MTKVTIIDDTMKTLHMILERKKNLLAIYPPYIAGLNVERQEKTHITTLINTTFRVLTALVHPQPQARVVIRQSPTPSTHIHILSEVPAPIQLPIAIPQLVSLDSLEIIEINIDTIFGGGSMEFHDVPSAPETESFDEIADEEGRNGSGGDDAAYGTGVDADEAVLGDVCPAAGDFGRRKG